MRTLVLADIDIGSGWALPSNAAAAVVVVYAVASVLRVPRAHWHNARGRVFHLMLVLAWGPEIHDVYVPTGAIVWLAIVFRTGGFGLRPQLDRIRPHGMGSSTAS